MLNPSDLVYVPTEEEIENPNLVDFSKMKKEQMNRIYKFRDGSINEKGGVQINFIPSNWASMIFKAVKNINEIKLMTNQDLKGEVTLTTDKDKSQNTIDGIQIKSVCWKLKVDRLGNISKA